MRMTMVGVAVLCGASLASAEEPWLPASAAEVVAGALYERVKAVAPDGPVPEDRLRETSRRSVDALAARFAAWGEKPLLERAPALRALGLPRAEQPQLDAMVRYFACGGVYEVLHARNGFAKAERDARILAAMAPSGFSLASLYLRTHYLRGGGTDAKMEAFMTSPQMERVVAALQDDAKMLDAAFQECRPVATWLVHQ
jgi:hypothetical protein